MKTSTRCVFVLVAWPLRLPEEWPEACGSLTVVGARTMHGLALSQLRIQQSDLRKAWIRSINLHIVVQYAINLSHSTNLCQYVIVWCYELMFTFHQRGPVAVAGDQFQCLSCQLLSYCIYIFYSPSREYWLARNRFSRLFAPIGACKINGRIWRHNASTSLLSDVTDQLWWRHNAKSERTFLSDNGGISDR